MGKAKFVILTIIVLFLLSLISSCMILSTVEAKPYGKQKKEEECWDEGENMREQKKRKKDLNLNEPPAGREFL